MAELKQVQSSRKGYRAHLNKLLQSADELFDTTQHLSKDNVAALKDLHEQLQWKQEVISAVDVKVLDAIKSDEQIEAEVLQTEDIASSISTTKAKITHCLRSISSAYGMTSRVHSSPPTPAVTVECHTEHK